ncbi:radial spoke head protein 3 homolog [Anopheles cruzii]|uniref:radial spoke head protein 3 homolog n=1 Tax=Anopheles cruzii TaxID=68878 RepID=UPI0022EC5C46|nr:radial spoke head protein 3 homolog [Anopheles cruzii]
MPLLSAHRQQEPAAQERPEQLLELESPAFTIVPSDQYQRSMIGKPNAIVRPLRHAGQPQQQQPQQQQREVIEGQHIVSLHPDYKLLHELEQQLIRSNRKSRRSAASEPKDDRNGQQQQQEHHQHPQQQQQQQQESRPFTHEFSRELDAKLRMLQGDSSKRSSKNGSTQEVNARKRPLFITTVPKGVFLKPCKDLPVLHASAPAPVQRRLYAFESRPRVLPAHGPAGKPPGAPNNNNDTSHPNYNHPGLEYICKHGSHHYNKPLARGPGIQPEVPTETTVRKVVTAATTTTELQSIGATGRGHRTARDQSQPGGNYQNVMHDRRVVRGSNYTSSSNLQLGDGDSTQKEAEARRRQMLRKKYVSRNQRGIIGTPPPVRGRRHETVQTEKYLEELFLHPPELDAGCQTDLFLHRPPSPPYIPAKSGCDAATEILDGELFDFDTEVQPIIEVLVSRTLEQALVEVLHEEEIAEMRRQQQKILALREAELAELRRLELDEQKRQRERERRFLQDKITGDLDREMQERITAAKLLEGRIDDLVPEVMAAADQLDSEKDREEFERQITPWLAREVAHEIGQWIDSRELLEDIIREIVKHKKKLLVTAEDQYDEVDPDDAPDEPVPSDAGGGEEIDGTVQTIEAPPEATAKGTEESEA